VRPSKQGGTAGHKPLVPENLGQKIVRGERFFVWEEKGKSQYFGSSALNRGKFRNPVFTHFLADIRVYLGGNIPKNRVSCGLHDLM
jgi:hypothetical protein